MGRRPYRRFFFLLLLLLGLAGAVVLMPRSAFVGDAGEPPATANKIPLQPPQRVKFGIDAQAGLVELPQVDPTLIIDLRYASPANFTGRPLYPFRLALLQQETARKLAAANQALAAAGYRLKVWDAYRPLRVQQIFWDALPDVRFFADPSHGSPHNRGTAVDVTLADLAGRELLLPSDFDEFGPQAHRQYNNAPPEALRRRELLTKAMEEHGFVKIQNEWWHFADVNSANYPVLDIGFEEFLLPQY